MRCGVVRVDRVDGVGLEEGAVGTQLHRSAGAVSEAGLARARQKWPKWQQRLGTHAPTDGPPSSSSIPPLRRPAQSLAHASLLGLAARRRGERCQPGSPTPLTHSARSHAILMAASPHLPLSHASASIPPPPPPPPTLIPNIPPFQHLLCIPHLASPRLRSPTLDLRIRSLPRKQGRPIHNKLQQSLLRPTIALTPPSGTGIGIHCLGSISASPFHQPRALKRTAASLRLFHRVAVP